MKFKKYLFSLILLLLTITILYAYFILGNQARSLRGTIKGREYVSSMYSDYSLIGKSCQGEDTDKNGYITCNFRLKKSGFPDQERTITLQCPTFLKSFMATNCKEQGVVINNQ